MAFSPLCRFALWLVRPPRGRTGKGAKKPDTLKPLSYYQSLNALYTYTHTDQTQYFTGNIQVGFTAEIVTDQSP